jgi:hypothetical protein
MKAYDPRDPEQILDDPRTWRSTLNPALLSAASDVGKIDWIEVAKLANECDSMALNPRREFPPVYTYRHAPCQTEWVGDGVCPKCKGEHPLKEITAGPLMARLRDSE